MTFEWPTSALKAGDLTDGTEVLHDVLGVQFRVVCNFVKLREQLRSQSIKTKDSIGSLSFRLFDENALTFASHSLNIEPPCKCSLSNACIQEGQNSCAEVTPNHASQCATWKKLRKLARPLSFTDVVEGKSTKCGSNLTRSSVVKFASTLVDGNNKPVTLATAQQVPKYKTWVHIDRNELTDVLVAQPERITSSITSAQGETIIVKEPINLTEMMDTFDSLFCRYCRRFDCSMHGTSKPSVEPCEKQEPFQPTGELQPCGEFCHATWNKSALQLDSSSAGMKGESVRTPAHNKNSSASICNANGLVRTVSSGRFSIRSILGNGSRKFESDDGPRVWKDSFATIDTELNSTGIMLSDLIQRPSKLVVEAIGSVLIEEIQGHDDDTGLSCFNADDVATRERVVDCWNSLEIDLCRKGLEIFGHNFCFIAKHFLKGMRTCAEVAHYVPVMGDRLKVCKSSMTETSISLKNSAVSVLMNQKPNTRILRPRRKASAKINKPMEPEGRRQASGYGRRGQMQNGADDEFRQFSPCNCTNLCGEHCPCLKRSTCCEKYCGCPKACTHRYAGCSCKLGYCFNNLCLCLSSCRECDPDVCKNCWIDCGGDEDGRSHNVKCKRERGKYLCRNMKMLAGKKRRLLLGISGVEGWGLFTKTALKPNDFVGEYVGELVSTVEAEHRDEQESKYLFDVNDTYTIDPLRRGNKVKFANHSWKPNCKPHIMQVGADYRVGIYAKQYIEAGSELFYSYYPDVESSPEWARNLYTAKPAKDQRGRSSTRKIM